MVYDEREYEPAKELWRAARINPRAHLKVSRIAFPIMIGLAVIAAVVIGWPS